MKLEAKHKTTAMGIVPTDSSSLAKEMPETLVRLLSCVSAKQIAELPKVSQIMTYKYGQ